MLLIGRFFSLQQTCVCSPRKYVLLDSFKTRHLGVLAIGMVFVIISAKIDLSVVP